MNNFLDVFSKIIKDNFISILQTLTSETVTLTLNSKGVAVISDFSKDFKNESLVSFLESFNNIKGGIFFHRQDLIGLSNLMLTGNFQKEEMFTDEKMDAAMEFLRQLLSSINVPFSEQFGEKVSFEVRSILEIDDNLEKDYDNEYYVMSYDLGIGENTINFVFFVDNEIDNIFKKEIESSEEKIQNIDLLLDVEVPIAVKIGSAKIFLKDLLNLTSGKVIELDQSVNEPIELTVNNKTIAYGEVVVADGYFGLRIKEILNKTERIKRLSDREV
jgi:flagellar motor switch protein FliN/FliY